VDRYAKEMGFIYERDAYIPTLIAALFSIVKTMGRNMFIDR
jgi:hypothetical protein